MLLPSIPPLNVVKPNRVETAENKKDETYHLNYGLYTLSAFNNPAFRTFNIKTLVNWNFYQNNQWVFEEDLEAFLKDESGDVRNRIRLVYNMVQPMVQQYIGNAIQMDFNAKARSISDFVINRREQELGRMKFFAGLANQMPSLKDSIKQSVPIADTVEETEDIFNNVYVDKYEKNINNLMKYVSEKNDFEQNKIEITKHIALSGLGIHKGYEYSGEQIWEAIDPLFFFFDYGAKRKDLKDAEYMGEIKYLIVPEILERFQDIKPEDRYRLENYSQGMGTYNQFMYNYVYGDTSNRIPVFEVYWKDIEAQEYGYVIDEFGYEKLCRINDEDGKYTDKDLIIPKNENYVKFIGKGKKKKKMYVDVLRFCIFTPASIVGTDIVLDYGKVAYQETYNLDPSNVEFPYKCCAWDLHNGLILSPIDAVIDPQRLANRMLSIAESRINNSRGTGTVIDKSAVDPQGGEEEILRNINQSKPVFIDTRGRGVPNSIGQYGSTLDSSTNFIFDVAERMRMIMNNISGVNESMTGTAGGKMKLLGVSEMEKKQGNILQENFYYTLSTVLLQSYQGIAGVGKRIYAESKRRLSMILGDEGAEEIIITKDMNLEDFRVFIKRVSSDEAQKEMSNQILTQLRGSGIIEEAEFANYYNRSDMDMVAEAIRESYKRRQLANKKKMEDAQKQSQMAVVQNQLQQEQVQSQQERAIQHQKEEQLTANEHDMGKVRERALLQMERDKQKAELKQ